MMEDGYESFNAYAMAAFPLLVLAFVILATYFWVKVKMKNKREWDE